MLTHGGSEGDGGAPFALHRIARSNVSLVKGRTKLAKMDVALDIDWTLCELIECVPGKVSGKPVVRGTRIMPDAIVGSYELGKRSKNYTAGFLRFP